MQPSEDMGHMEHMGHAGHMGTGAPTFFDLWSPWILLLTVALIVGYFYLVGPLRSRFAGSSPVSTGQKWSAVTAALLIYLSEGTPIGYYGHGQSFAMHMLQMSFLYLMLPPFVFIALPDWLLRPVLERPSVRKWLFPLTHPLLTIFLFNMAFSFYHIPGIFNAAFENMVLHTLYHAILGVLAFFMWFPVFCPLPEWNRLSELQKMAYIFANGVLLTPACALIIFASNVMYPFTLPESWLPYMSQLDDQQLGGTIMKVLQEVIYGTGLAYTFFRWYRRERKKEEEDDLLDNPSLLEPSTSN
jgi:putative membrane protein